MHMTYADMKYKHEHKLNYRIETDLVKTYGTNKGVKTMSKFLMPKDLESEKSIKDFQDEKFNWFTPTNYKPKTSKDVSINMIKIGGTEENPRKGFSVVLRNNCGDKYGNFIQVAIYKGRVFFRPSEANEGFYVRNRDSKNRTDNRYLQIPLNDETEGLKQFIGDYDMKHDDFYELDFVTKVQPWVK